MDIEQNGEAQTANGTGNTLNQYVVVDACGVRYETSKQSKILNGMARERAEKNGEVPQEELREKIGHTPLEVFAGAALGIAIGFIMF